MTDYASPPGGLPPQSAFVDTAAVFTDAYAVIPAAVMTDIVTSAFPGWKDTRGWVLARPLSGFAETFSQIAMEVGPGGGTASGEPDARVQSVLFVTSGAVQLGFGGTETEMGAGGYAYLPAGVEWSLRNRGFEAATFQWIRKRYEAVAGVEYPAPFVVNERDVAPIPMPDTDKWSTTRFVDTADMRHDMHVNIVNLAPGGIIPFAETHVMEHGIYILEGTASYLLNRDWIDVGPGDFLWLRAFCPQACKATGDAPFRYLLYKDVNRLPQMG